MQTAVDRPPVAEPPLAAETPVADFRRGRPTFRLRSGPWLLHIPLILGAALMLFPFYWMLSTSLKGIEEASAFPPTLWPAQWQWDNYIRAWQAAPFARYLVNTVFVATG